MMRSAQIYTNKNINPACSVMILIKICVDLRVSHHLRSESFYYFFFIKETIHNSKIAPAVAVISDQIILPPPIPNKPNNHPPRKPPTIPIIKFITRPLPDPLKIMLPKQPAANPIKINHKKAIILKFLVIHFI